LPTNASFVEAGITDAQLWHLKTMTLNLSGAMGYFRLPMAEDVLLDIGRRWAAMCVYEKKELVKFGFQFAEIATDRRGVRLQCVLSSLPSHEAILFSTAHCDFSPTVLTFRPLHSCPELSFDYILGEGFVYLLECFIESAVQHPDDATFREIVDGRFDFLWRIKRSGIASSMPAALRLQIANNIVCASTPSIHLPYDAVNADDFEGKQGDTSTSSTLSRQFCFALSLLRTAKQRTRTNRPSLSSNSTTRARRWRRT
jgi:hypothetical protein